MHGVRLNPSMTFISEQKRQPLPLAMPTLGWIRLPWRFRDEQSEQAFYAVRSKFKLRPRKG